MNFPIDVREAEALVRALDSYLPELEFALSRVEQPRDRHELVLRVVQHLFQNFMGPSGAWLINEDTLVITSPNPFLLPERSKNFAARLAYYIQPAGQLCHRRVLEQVAQRDVDAERVAHLRERAGGSDDDEVVVPPTIHALLAARLDALSREERAIVDPASVIGLVFPGSTAQQLLPETPRAVVVVPRGWRPAEGAPLQRVGCGYDGSPENIDYAEEGKHALEGRRAVRHFFDVPFRRGRISLAMTSTCSGWYR